jgi:hypothetical protein
MPDSGRQERLPRLPDWLRGTWIMVERRKELKRRRHRREKMLKLKSKLAVAKDGRERDNILRKIRMLSPLWTELQPS